jgi:hypothetical protein
MDDHQIHAIYALYSEIEDMFCPLRLNLRLTYKPNPYPTALSSFTDGRLVSFPFGWVVNGLTRGPPFQG